MQYFYTVRSGDTLNKIAKQWELPVESLIAANNLTSPNTITAGQQLSIPPGVNMYSVQSSDSVYRISQIYGVPASVVIEANELEPPYILRVNQLLKIPPGIPYYIVQEGDTLFEIAKRYHVTTSGQSDPALLQKVNQLPSTTIHPDMKLTIPYSFTGANGFIAYTSNRGGQHDIWVYNMRNREDKQLTDGIGDTFSEPVWSPDGNRIAFIGKDRIVYVIYVEDGLTAGVDQLEEGGDLSLDWSPDSSSLAYTARGIIVLYNATLHEAQTVEQPGASDVRWFPNGTELLFQALDTSGNSQIYRIQTNGTDKQQITKNSGGPLHDIRLSPDGKFALYTTPGASISIIQTIELSTGKVYEVEGGPLTKNYSPEWSPNSLQIAYSSTAYEERGYFSEVRTVGRQGENDRIWAIASCFQTPVTWSPDGDKIAYLSGCTEQEFAHEMWVIDLSRPVPIRLIGDINILSLSWSPTQITD